MFLFTSKIFNSFIIFYFNKNFPINHGFVINLIREILISDNAEKVTSELHDTCTLKIAPTQHKREDLVESTSVVPAKYPPKVKLELLATLKC